VRILVVEDERKLAQALVTGVEAQHYDVVAAPTGEDGFFRANAKETKTAARQRRSTRSKDVVTQ